MRARRLTEEGTSTEKSVNSKANNRRPHKWDVASDGTLVCSEGRLRRAGHDSGGASLKEEDKASGEGKSHWRMRLRAGPGVQAMRAIDPRVRRCSQKASLKEEW